MDVGWYLEQPAEVEQEHLPRTSEMKILAAERKKYFQYRIHLQINSRTVILFIDVLSYFRGWLSFTNMGLSSTENKVQTIIVHDCISK